MKLYCGKLGGVLVGEKHHYLTSEKRTMGPRIMIETDKLVLDACCGGRMMWFNKSHPLALYIDIREADKGLCPERPEFCVKPDLIADFRDLPFADRSFKLIAWDPPHIRTLTETSIMRKKFGALNAETWRYDLGKGFDELWRVLDNHGALIFKWNESDIMLKDVLACFKQEPLFGHTTGSKSKTHWCVFFKNIKRDQSKADFTTSKLPNLSYTGVRKTKDLNTYSSYTPVRREKNPSGGN